MGVPVAGVPAGVRETVSGLAPAAAAVAVAAMVEGVAAGVGFAARAEAGAEPRTGSPLGVP
ncbi:MAG TPA: hypothetical protein VFN65_07435 [Solirubrobacteraceae bacterium]|nr:hypothetical protein [Solirubrobacteraceae bacterium]